MSKAGWMWTIIIVRGWARGMQGPFKLISPKSKPNNPLCWPTKHFKGWRVWRPAPLQGRPTNSRTVRSHGSIIWATDAIKMFLSAAVKTIRRNSWDEYYNKVFNLTWHTQDIIISIWNQYENILVRYFTILFSYQVFGIWCVFYVHLNSSQPSSKCSMATCGWCLLYETVQF